MLYCVCLHISALSLDMLGCTLWARCHFRVSEHIELHLHVKQARHSVYSAVEAPTCPQCPTCHEAHSCCWHVCTDSGLDESQNRSSSRSSPNWHQVCRCLYPFPQVTKHYTRTYTHNDTHVYYMCTHKYIHRCAHARTKTHTLTQSGMSMNCYMLELLLCVLSLFTFTKEYCETFTHFCWSVIREACTQHNKTQT